MESLALGAAFVAGFLLITGISLAMSDSMEARRRRASSRIAEEYRGHRQHRIGGPLNAEELQQLAEGAEDLQDRPGLMERFNRMVEQSGLLVRPLQVVAVSAALALFSGVAAWVIGRAWYYPAAAATVLGSAPIAYVSWRRAQRMEKMLSQLPDVFDMMARMMRAGRTIPQASQAVADEFPSPVAEEFQYCCEQQNLGLPAEAAMRDLARRTGLLELRIFVLAVIVHTQAGGNLTQLLEKLAQVIRDRYRIRGQIKALTAQGRMEALVLLLLPPVMMVALLFISRPYIMNLFRFPGAIVGMFALMTVGALWMRKIINFDF